MEPTPPERMLNDSFKAFQKVVASSKQALSPHVAQAEARDTNDQHKQGQPLLIIQGLRSDHWPGNRTQDGRERHRGLQAQKTQKGGAVARRENQAQVEDCVNNDVDCVGRQGIVLLHEGSEAVH
eukprot:CAMPEP_0115540548 /NCGR_PEP_ID=MMETSP0271-20121206/89991_1 /TAXON_ID=71861 /ORGANISM="Scrippsiella trochoidea, Strain CCMP3099" /LENGTH=123 /DNA_ID=CAMNT_0002973559 /DNA_START=223 /DNA_END=595 /DNA_ORIENTATION=-